jgi:hypothetical protein
MNSKTPFTRLLSISVQLGITLNKLRCSKQALYALNIFAWNNGKRPRSYIFSFYWFDTDQEVMINRSSWGH